MVEEVCERDPDRLAVAQAWYDHLAQCPTCKAEVKRVMQLESAGISGEKFKLCEEGKPLQDALYKSMGGAIRT